MKELRKRLSEYVRLAASGETILVCDGDREMAELRPPQPGVRAPAGDEGLAELVRRGLLTPATRSGQGPPPRLPVMTFKELMIELDRDREDR